MTELLRRLSPGPPPSRSLTGDTLKAFEELRRNAADGKRERGTRGETFLSSFLKENLERSTGKRTYFAPFSLHVY
jgi:hypothetical protein